VEEVTRGMRNLHDERFRDLYSQANIITVVKARIFWLQSVRYEYRFLVLKAWSGWYRMEELCFGRDDL